ncbi:MAG: M23 family metallopeptidase [Novosphingobium sp.]
MNAAGGHEAARAAARLLRVFVLLRQSKSATLRLNKIRAILTGSLGLIAILAPAGAVGAAGAISTAGKSSRPVRLDKADLIPGPNGGLQLAQPRLTVTGTMRIKGTVGASLYRSARAAGGSPAAVQHFLQALDPRVDFGEIAPDDRFEFVVAYSLPAGGAAVIGRIIHLDLTSSCGRSRLVARQDAAGLATLPAPFPDRTPLVGRLTSGFGMRFHPILGRARMHAGIDLAAAYGAPVRAVSDGTVAFAGWHGGHGNFVRLDAGGGDGSGYAHMSRIAVAPGMRVLAGQVIGYVGSTGLSTGPHLHYELYRGGRTVNPLSGASARAD